MQKNFYLTPWFKTSYYDFHNTKVAKIFLFAKKMNIIFDKNIFDLYVSFYSFTF